MLITLLAFAVAIGLLVTIHELGHYWVAKRCGVHIERFSIGFGRVLFKRTDKHGCEWAISALPLGGYVMMRSQVPEQAPEAIKQSAFESKTVGQRAAITVAGPVANLLLAVLLYALVGWVGTQEPAALLAQPPLQTAAAQAGIEAGDRVLALDQKPVASWSQLRWQLLDKMHTGANIDLTLERAGGAQVTRSLYLPPSLLEPEQDPLALAGLMLATPQPSVRQVIAGSAAARAGLMENDILVAIDAEPIQSAKQFVEAIQARPDQTIQLTVLREEQPLTIPVQVEAYLDDKGIKTGRVGIMLGANIEMVTVRYGPIQSIQQGLTRTVDTFWISLKMLARMVTGDVSVKNISGPVSIADYAGQSARIGLSAYIHFLALISISIGLLNLLPIPMLDGGHLLYYAIEAVTGRPVSDEIKLVGQRIGIALLAALTMLAFFNDFNRLLN